MVLLTELPVEVLEEVMSYLDGWSTQSLGASCTFLHALTGQDRIWHRLMARSDLSLLFLVNIILTLYFQNSLSLRRLFFSFSTNRQIRKVLAFPPILKLVPSPGLE